MSEQYDEFVAVNRTGHLPWTAERIGLLRQLSGEGHTNSQIALRLGGITRNAVIGKRRRLGIDYTKDNGHAHNGRLGGIASRNSPKPKRKKKSSFARTTPPVSRALAAEVSVDPSPELPPHLILENCPTIEQLKSGEITQCRWPVADNPTRFCGEKTSKRGHGSYCAYHARQAYVPVNHRPKPGGFMLPLITGKNA